MTTKNGAFKLGMFVRSGKPKFVGIVTGDHVVELGAADTAFRAARGHTARSLPPLAHDMMLLLDDWDRNFARLQGIVEFLGKESLTQPHLASAVYDIDKLDIRPPVPRPSKILNAAANYSGHLAEMRAYTQTGGGVDPAKIYAGDKKTGQPYLFLKAPSALSGAHDDIVLPEGAHQCDWEAELAVVIGRTGKRVTAARAMEHVAGFMTFNDVSCRTLLFREDRPNLRTDWLSSKSFDTFAPCGPFLVPRAFVVDHAALHIRLEVNGQIRQDGVAGDMIFSPEEQIEYASRMMTLEPGDIFATGTVAGVGQGAGIFLKPSDVVETEVQGLGRQKNRVVAATS